MWCLHLCNMWWWNQVNAVDRLGHQFIGAPCEVSGCSFSVENGDSWDGKPDRRCYDHSINRLIDALKVSVPCKNEAVECTTRSTKVNEQNVHMCDSCYNIYQRIQRENRVNRDVYSHREIDCEGMIEILRGDELEEEPEAFFRTE